MDKNRDTQEQSGTHVAPKKHDSGSGANETMDGLDSTNEAIRQGAEDIPVGLKKKKDVPVFDRGRE